MVCVCVCEPPRAAWGGWGAAWGVPPRAGVLADGTPQPTSSRPSELWPEVGESADMPLLERASALWLYVAGAAGPVPSRPPSHAPCPPPPGLGIRCASLSRWCFRYRLPKACCCCLATEGGPRGRVGRRDGDPCAARGSPPSPGSAWYASPSARKVGSASEVESGSRCDGERRGASSTGAWEGLGWPGLAGGRCDSRTVGREVRQLPGLLALRWMTARGLGAGQGGRCAWACDRVQVGGGTGWHRVTGRWEWNVGGSLGAKERGEVCVRQP